MSDSTPRRPRHALADDAGVPTQSRSGSEDRTGSIPGADDRTGSIPGADDQTQALPVVPAQRSGLVRPAFALPPPAAHAPVSPPPSPRLPMDPASAATTRAAVDARRPTVGVVPQVYPTSAPRTGGSSRPGSSRPGSDKPGPAAEPRRRAVATALAGLTAVLLVGGIVVGIGGGSGTDVTDRPATTGTP